MMTAREALGYEIEDLLNEAQGRGIDTRKIVREILEREIHASKMDMHIDYIHGRVQTCDCCGAGKEEAFWAAEEEYNEAQNRLNHSYAVTEYGLDADD